MGDAIGALAVELPGLPGSVGRVRPEVYEARENQSRQRDEKGDVMKKPDRISRMVEKEYHKWLEGPQEKGWLSIAENLLRREHRWMVQLLNACYRDTDDPSQEIDGRYIAGHKSAYRYILTKLKERAK